MTFQKKRAHKAKRSVEEMPKNKPHASWSEEDQRYYMPGEPRRIK